MKKPVIFWILFFVIGQCPDVISEIQPAKKPETKGTLFIIGGGKISEALTKQMVDLMPTGRDGYALVFTQTSSEPDTSFYYVKKRFRLFSENPILMWGDSVFDESMRDSIRNASLIYITGGDQGRFLSAVDSLTQQAIRDAYHSGAMVAGTSAGAALMSSLMITGDQRMVEEYESTYSSLIYNNGIYAKGLGLLDSVIVDQHFVTRSRYNRIISAMADTNLPYGIGIEESTALIVAPDYMKVAGENQVILFRRPGSYFRHNDRIGLRNLRINIYLPGDTFHLK